MIINLSSVAFILWSGMLVIAGAVIVLSSQVRHLVELLESQQTATPSRDVRVRAVSGAPLQKRTRNAGPRAAAAAPSRATRRCLTARTPA